MSLLDGWPLITDYSYASQSKMSLHIKVQYSINKHYISK